MPLYVECQHTDKSWFISTLTMLHEPTRISYPPTLPLNDQNVLHFPDFPYNVENIFYAQGL